jgi:hypothetical protein
LLVEDITTIRTDTDGQALGPDNAIDVLKWLEKAAFRLVFIAFFGSNAIEDHSLIQELLQEFRDAFAITSDLSAQAEMAWETILPSHLFSTLFPVNDVRKTKRSMRGIKGHCRRQIAQRKSQVRTTCYQHDFHSSVPGSVSVLELKTDFTSNSSTHLRLALYLTRIS